MREQLVAHRLDHAREERDAVEAARERNRRSSSAVGPAHLAVPEQLDLIAEHREVLEDEAALVEVDAREGEPQLVADRRAAGSSHLEHRGEQRQLQHGPAAGDDPARAPVGRPLRADHPREGERRVDQTRAIGRPTGPTPRGPAGWRASRRTAATSSRTLLGERRVLDLHVLEQRREADLGELDAPPGRPARPSSTASVSRDRAGEPPAVGGGADLGDQDGAGLEAR
jgi:hypothetical protein